MDGQDGPVPARPALDEGTLSLYRWAVRHEGLGPAVRRRAMAQTGLDEAGWSAAVAALVAAGLLRPDGADEPCDPLGSGWRAVSPEAAGAQVLAGQEQALRVREAELRTRREQVHELRDFFSALMPAYLEGREQARPEAAVDLLADKHAVRAVLTETVQHCRREVLISKPGGSFPARALAEARPRDLELLARGVRMRSLYQHTTRFDRPTRVHAEQLIAAGAQIRTLPEVLPQMIVVDGRLAFLPARPESHGALLVREPSLLAFLLAVFERDWQQASPFTTGPQAAHEVSETLKQTILVLLAKGLKDESIARRLGISLRTCRRHVSELLDTLGATSRFQAGAIAERLGLTDFLAEDAPDGPAAAPCSQCGAPLPAPAAGTRRGGRPARYCSARCRTRAYRTRRAPEPAAGRDESTG